jgi:hypothetical protein
LAQGGQALAKEGGSGGVHTRRAEHHVKAGAAYVMDQLHRAGMPRELAAERVAEVLAAGRFPFGKRRKRVVDGVMAWRRDYPRGNDSAALAYQKLTTKPPYKVEGNLKTQERIALKWLGDLLARAGYGAVA